ncbi:MAG: hypothetical protein QGH51_04205 [Planctomycetota bacterium]|jgi:hypothetical protein|nr:hypothetical protein [Planctomycetota bacterium]
MKMHTLFPALLLLASPVFAQQDRDPAPAEAPSIQEALETALPPIWKKAVEALKQPWDSNLSFNVELEEATVQGTGTASFFSSRMFAFDLNIAGTAAGQDLSAHIQAVGDDDFLTILMEASELPAPQAFKIDLDVLEEMQQQGGFDEAIAMNGMGIEELEMFLGSIDFKETKVDDGATTRISSDLTSLLDMAAASGEDVPESLSFVMDFNSKTSFPRQVSVDLGGVGKVGFSFSNVSFPEEFDESKYVFEAPQGVFPMDVTMMIRAGMQESGSPGYEEEF